MQTKIEKMSRMAGRVNSLIETLYLAVEDLPWFLPHMANQGARTFGSVLTDQFRADSDVDVLVTFEEPTRWSLFDVVDMKDELERLFGRKVDFVGKAGHLCSLTTGIPWRQIVGQD